MIRALQQFWSRFQVSTRIALAILATLLCIQGLTVLQFVLTPGPRWTVYGARWLAQSSKEAAEAAFGSPVAQRNEVLGSLGISQWLVLRWQPERPPFPPKGVSFFSDRIEATLREALGGARQEVRVDFGLGGPEAPFRTSHLQFVPPDLEGSLRGGALRADEPEIAVPGRFHIHIRGDDGSWLTITPRGGPEERPMRLWLPLVGGTLVVVLLSLFTARRILAPLGHLKRAAERLGVEREPAPINTRGLGEFSPIASAFNDMRARLNRFVDDRTQMLAAISHDLRTSLTRFRLAVEEIDAQEPKAILERDIDEMEAMISATLSFATRDAKGEKSQMLDVAALVISLCDNVSDRGGCVSYCGPDHVRLRCQPIAMKRALGNIVDNAIKYGGKADVFLETTDAGIVIRVCDQGPGIPSERRGEAFAPFRRLESSRNRETGGVGLGLTIARDVVQAHGGNIELGDAAPRGLVVTVTLPQA